MECPMCKGTKETVILVFNPDQGQNAKPEVIECPMCNGTGKV